MKDNGSSVLKIKNLQLDFKHFSLKIEDFSLKQGKFTVVLGKNGAGKTTFLNVLGGYYKPRKKFTKIVNGKIAYVHEQPNFFPMLKVSEIVNFLQSKSLLNSVDFKQFLVSFGLEHQLNYFCSELSKGSKMKLSLFISFVLDRDIYIFDEPFSGVDVIGVKDIKDSLLTLKKRGQSVLVSTHILDAIKDLVDEIYLLNNGRIVEYICFDKVNSLLADNKLDNYIFNCLKK
jgi:ABC-2 type transport system ATP-binding protein